MVKIKIKCQEIVRYYKEVDVSEKQFNVLANAGGLLENEIEPLIDRTTDASDSSDFELTSIYYQDKNGKWVEI